MNDLDVIRKAADECEGFFEAITIQGWAEFLLAIEAQGWELAERLDDE